VEAISELVKRDMFSVDHARYEHLALLEEVAGLHVPRGMSTATVGTLSGKGLKWIVPASFVKKFKHHAVVNPVREMWIITRISTVFRMELGREYWEQPRYIGDIPDSILRRCLSAREAGIKHLTVHSNMPLPVRWEVVKTDPIILGWLDNPRIVVRRGKVVSFGDVQAVVVGIWDAEKEISIE
jgi:hypothetical protein